MRSRRIPLAIVKPGPSDGPVYHADYGFQIDTWRHCRPSYTRRRDRANLVSDDNFSFLQRTLLLQFTLLEP